MGTGTSRPDVIVIGTGFGGSVTGARLAERGLRVLMLERGPWWGPGGDDQAPECRREFPRGIAGMRRLVRGLRYARGRGFDLTMRRDGLWELHLFERLACLVASGVGGGSLVYTSMQVQPEDAFFDAFPPEITADELRPAYDAVRDVLAPRPVPEPPPKTRAFERALLAQGMGKPTYPDLAVRFGGDPSGRVDASKATLDLTYLALARRHGAEIRALCDVTALGRVRGGYAVRYRDRSRGSETVAHAPRVVVSAGTLGTLRLLFAARDRDRTLDRLPASLGRGFSPDGNMGAFVCGAAGPIESGDGPAACAYHTVRDAAGRHRYLVAEVGLPLAALPLPGPAHRRLSRSLVLFGMGRDEIAADVGFDGRRLQIDPRSVDGARLYTELKEMLGRIAAGYRPQRVLLNAPYGRGSRSLLSVHPLGGAAVAGSPERGVVDHTGQVFGHPGLFVADGSVYPEAPGLPPSMTIAALAERQAGFVAESTPDASTPTGRSLT